MVGNNVEAQNLLLVILYNSLTLLPPPKETKKIGNWYKNRFQRIYKI